MRGGVKSEEKELGRRCRLGREEESHTKAGGAQTATKLKINTEETVPFFFLATGAQSAKLKQSGAPPPRPAFSWAFYTTVRATNRRLAG